MKQSARFFGKVFTVTLLFGLCHQGFGMEKELGEPMSFEFEGGTGTIAYASGCTGGTAEDFLSVKKSAQEVIKGLISQGEVSVDLKVGILDFGAKGSRTEYTVSWNK